LPEIPEFLPDFVKTRNGTASAALQMNGRAHLILSGRRLHATSRIVARDRNTWATLTPLCNPKLVIARASRT
jgi:hypothetical protein